MLQGNYIANPSSAYTCTLDYGFPVDPPPGSDEHSNPLAHSLEPRLETGVCIL